jgi:hypothetical protein
MQFVDPKIKQRERIMAHHEFNSPQRWHGIITQCCKCRRFKIRGLWMYFPLSHGLRVSHGYCPNCKDKVLKQINKEVS